MSQRTTPFVPVKASLRELAGGAYTEALCDARAALTGESVRELCAVTTRKVDFYPRTLQKALSKHLSRVGSKVARGLTSSAAGAGSAAFNASIKSARAPLSGLGFLRVGEDGRVCLTSKSEHYHLPLGHAFGGYELVGMARALGVCNATHNNTRGHITRLLEQELVRSANGIAKDDPEALGKALTSRSATVLNRVLNLETGSLAAEAALKMVLSRFYMPQPGCPEPKHAGRTPVVLVLGDDEGGPEANYHGTTVLTQIMRGMWPGLAAGLEEHGLFRVRSVRVNAVDELEAAFEKYDRGSQKIAGFFHELALMNYGARRLTKRFIRRAYALCRKHDVPTINDEIQSCVWAPGLYMFHEYGIRPSMVVLGKGFPGGEYAASRIIFSSALDTLPQFGALVTNGQEELASLAYLVTMAWAEANTEVTAAVGDDFERQLRAFGAQHGDRIASVEGRRHLAGVYFHELDQAKAFTGRLNKAGLDISVQTYKEGCPPAALLKLPLTAGYDLVDFVLDRLQTAMA
ncbi:MAG: aminotransferase class III-fold pyridoxal phosphate-dependent enzyme [bacterium]|nr:aminotransferase class III-fold pyridoxal phosphate-dependent enzyme [bacterium]